MSQCSRNARTIIDIIVAFCSCLKTNVRNKMFHQIIMKLQSYTFADYIHTIHYCRKFAESQSADAAIHVDQTFVLYIRE